MRRSAPPVSNFLSGVKRFYGLFQQANIRLNAAKTHQALGVQPFRLFPSRFSQNAGKSGNKRDYPELSGICVATSSENHHIPAQPAAPQLTNPRASVWTARALAPLSIGVWRWCLRAWTLGAFQKFSPKPALTHIYPHLSAFTRI